MPIADADNQWIAADQPIAKRADDRLSRSEFSQELANAIGGWSGNSSLTIALYGSWGSGKSSVKNMAVEYLNERPAPRPTIIEFNPWRWNSSDELAEAFFREVGRGLGKGDDVAQAKKLSKLWLKYSATFSLAAEIVSAVPKFIGGVLICAGSLSLLGYALAIPQTARAIDTLLLAGAPLVAGLLLWSGAFSTKLAKYFEAKAAASERSLDERRDDLEKELSKRTSPVVVIVDDIDRLAADRVALVFQLIKATADLPKFVYLLLFQRETIEKSLDGISNGDGARFLEKIVQVGLNLPHIAKPEVEKILFAGLNTVLGEVNTSTFDQTRWGNVYVGGLNAYFRTIRDVKRYLASLQFHVPLFVRGTTFEVNIIDLFTVEAIRVFEPQAYEKLRSAKPLLTGSRTRDRSEDSARKVALERFIADATEGRQKDLQEVLVRLFPQIASAFGGTEWAAESYEGWLRELRICSPDVYDRYLHFSLPPNDVSQVEVDELISLSHDRKQLVASLRALHTRGVIGTAMDRLDANRDRIPRDSAIPFVTSLFDIGDELDGMESLGSIVGPEIYLSRLLHRYLKEQQDPKERLAIITNAMRETTGVVQPVQLADRETDEKLRSESPEKLLVDENDAKILVSLALQKIRDAAANGALHKSRHLATLLYRWLKWDGPEAPRKWVTGLCASPDGALVLLNALTHRGLSQSMDDNVGRVTTRVSLSELEKFVDLQLLEEKITQLSQADRNAEERTAIKKFQQALRRRRKGKPDRGFLDRDDEDDS